MTDLIFKETRSPARIKVVGVGGCGGNIVNHMCRRSAIGVEYAAINTDAQALEQMDGQTVECVHIGMTRTNGLGAGANPEVAAQAVGEEEHRLRESLGAYDMVFITAGMGKGTGTGASPYVARWARESGALVVAVVTRPFARERRNAQADKGLLELTQEVDSLIVVPNEKLREVMPEASIMEARLAANEVLYNAVYGISEIINRSGTMNLDFNDVRSVMSTQGKSVIGSAVGSGENRAQDAVIGALKSPLMEDVDLSTAEHMLVNITGDERKVTNREHDEIDQIISEYIPNCVNGSFNGSVHDDEMGDKLRVTIIVTGLRDDAQARKPTIETIGGGGDASLVSGRQRRQNDKLREQFGGDERRVPAVLRKQLS